MPGWLTNAANVFRRQVAAPTQSYSVRCNCGRLASGERTRVAQSVVCPTCEARLFILPASVYPVLKAQPPKKASRARPERSATLGSGCADRKRPAGNADDIPSAPGGSPTRSLAKYRTQPQRIVSDDRQGDGAKRTALPLRRRRAGSPLRLVLAGVALVVAVTGWWLVHLRALDQARQVIASVPRIAEGALHEGDVSEAARQFGRVRAAVELLRRDDPAARRWKQLARETAALSDLASAPLHAILQEAVEAAAGDHPKVWHETFRINYRGGWVLIDASVSRSTGQQGGEAFQIDYPLAVGAVGARLVGDLPDFSRRVPDSSSPQRVIFAAQLADCRPDNAGPSAWRIDLHPETGFLWADAATYALLGLPTDEDSLRTLAEQSRLLGIDP